jgi:hypothetical protein
MSFDRGMPASWTVENIRRLGDTPEQLADSTQGFWRCLRTEADAEAYEAAVAASVATHGFKPTRWSIWFHATDLAFVLALSMDTLPQVFRSQGIAWAREQAEAVALEARQ